MIAATRRQAMMGALAVPTLAGMPQWRWHHGEGAVLLHDPALDLGRRFAAAGKVRGAQVFELAGDRVRLARQVLDARPALIAGVSLYADALMIEDVAAEAGYRRVLLLQGGGQGCSATACHAGWQALARVADAAGGDWVEALADYASKPGGAAPAPSGTVAPGGAGSPVHGWLLARG